MLLLFGVAVLPATAPGEAACFRSAAPDGFHKLLFSVHINTSPASGVLPVEPVGAAPCNQQLPR